MVRCCKEQGPSEFNTLDCKYMKFFKRALQIITASCIILIIFFQCQSVPEEEDNPAVKGKRKKRKPQAGSGYNTAEMYPGLSPELVKTLPKHICRRLAHIGLTYDQELAIINAYKSFYSTHEREELDRLKEERKNYKRGSLDYQRLTEEMNQIRRINRIDSINRPFRGNFYLKLREILTEEQYRLYRSMK